MKKISQKPDKLKEAREEIDKIDREMAALFERRMRAVEAVADYKRANGLPITDSVREEAILRKNAEYIESEELRPFYLEFESAVMRVSRHYQHKQLSGIEGDLYADEDKRMVGELTRCCDRLKVLDSFPGGLEEEE